MAEESRVDAHDRNKLDRMWQDLSAEAEAHSSLHAMFLVTREQSHAHDAFRRLRQAYEEAAAPFHTLTIFGQHGVSAAGRLLAQGLGLAEEEIPALVLFDLHDGHRATLIPLGPPVQGAEKSEVSGEVRAALDRFIGGGCSAQALGHAVEGHRTARECAPALGSMDALLRDTMERLAASLSADQGEGYPNP